MLELNNFDEAEQICNFQEGQYYKFVALARAKDLWKTKNSWKNINQIWLLYVMY